MKFWKKKSEDEERKQRINDGFRHVDARSTEESEESSSARSTGRGRRGSTYHFEPEVILPGITQVPRDRSSQHTEHPPPRKSNTWHQGRESSGRAFDRSRSRSRSSSISSRESSGPFSEAESLPSSISEYSYEYTPPPRKTQTRSSRGKGRPRERVVVTETFVGGKLHTRETETFTYKDSGPDTSSGSEASSDQHFSPNRERQYSERDRRGPPPFRRDSRRRTPRDDIPFRDAPFYRDSKRPRYPFTTPTSDRDVRFEHREPKFHMPPRRDTSPERRGPSPPRWKDAPPRRRAPRPPRWDDPPSFSRPRDYRRQSAPEPRDSAPKPTTSPGGHDATAQELPEKVKDKLKPLDEPRWEKASNEALCQHIFKTFPPKTDGPKTYDEQVPGKLERKDLLKMIVRFHPDKNTEHGDEWKLTCSEIVKHLNKRLSEWK